MKLSVSTTFTDLGRALEEIVRQHRAENGKPQPRRQPSIRKPPKLRRLKAGVRNDRRSP